MAGEHVEIVVGNLSKGEPEQHVAADGCGDVADDVLHNVDDADVQMARVRREFLENRGRSRNLGGPVV